jgi:raffinose/stachyose/melibiose transport system permease protein
MYDQTKRVISWTFAIGFAVCCLIISILPFIYMVLNSFKGKFEMLTKGVFSFPESVNWFNYIAVLSGGFFRYLGNSVLVLGVSLFLLLFITACASYPLARFTFTFHTKIYAMIIACMTIPIHITLIPIFKMANTMGCYDSIWALIGPYVAFGVPISVFILTGFMKGIPREVEESASIDGCSKYRIFFTIVLPLSTPGLSTLAIYNGVNIWNEFVFAYTLTQSPLHRTLPLAVWEFQGQYSMDIPMIMAVLTLTILPMILLFAFFQDKLVKGITAGAVKG